jgi:hypothetical protein
LFRGLVGSEMCIRDRGHTGHGQQRQSQQGRNEDVFHEELQKKKRTSV